MLFGDHFNTNWLLNLQNQPYLNIHGMYQDIPYSAAIAIPNYRERLIEHYALLLKNGLEQFCQQVEIPFLYRHYGLVIRFAKPAELELHDPRGTLDEGLAGIIVRTGPVIIRNACLHAGIREAGHRNRFPHLNFHIDRSENQPTQYSMYTRDPFDPEQRFPRTSSTLFVPSIVGPLQAALQGDQSMRTRKGRLNTYSIFMDEDCSKLMNNIILEHSWDEPEGIGEISMLDNRTTLHASYYRDTVNKGYKIGVRYLA
jgi:hypothetical protein